MGLRVTQRRQRRNINAEDARQAYTELLHHPTNKAIDTYISQFNSPSGGEYVLDADDYDVARYLLAMVHSAGVPNAASVFLDTLGLKLNNEMADYRLALSRLEKKMLDRSAPPETEVKAPSKSADAKQRVLSPIVRTQNDRDQKGADRVRFV